MFLVISAGNFYVNFKVRSSENMSVQIVNGRTVCGDRSEYGNR